MSLHNATGIVFAAPPPNGVEPDPTGPFQAADYITVSAIFFPLAVITTAIRIYTRGFLIRKLSMDDYIMVVALSWTVVMMGSILDMLNWGLAKDMWNVPLTPNLFPNFMLRNIIAAIAFCLATGFAKGSILLFYLRIFPTKSMKYTVWSLFFFTVGYSVACAFVNVFSCNPIEASWRIELAATGKCIDRPLFYFAQASLGIFTDITTLVAPLPLLKTLRLPTKQKIGVALILTVGAFVCVVSIIRLKSLYTLLTNDNLTRNTKDALMWCVLELNLSITGGNIPALRPFIQRVFPRLLGSSRGTSGRRGGGGSGVGSGGIGSYGRQSNSKKSRRTGTMGTSSSNSNSNIKGRSARAQDAAIPGNDGFGTEAFAAAAGRHEDRSYTGYLTRMVSSRALCRTADHCPQHPRQEASASEEYIVMADREQQHHHHQHQYQHQHQQSLGIEREGGTHQRGAGSVDLGVITKQVEFGFQESPNEGMRWHGAVSR